MITTTRQCAGSYRYVHTDGTVYIIEQIATDTAEGSTIANPSGKNPNAGMWVYRPELGYPDDIFYTKREALDGLAALLGLTQE